MRERQSFNEEQVAELLKNPYTLTVTSKSIRFTDTFKKEFWKMLVKGKSPEDICDVLGYNPLLLGKRRIINLVQSLKREHAGERESVQTLAPSKPVFQSMNDELQAVHAELAEIKQLLKQLLEADSRLNH